MNCWLDAAASLIITPGQPKGFAFVRNVRIFIALTTLIALLGLVIGLAWRSSAQASFSGETAPIERGNLRVTIAADGLVQARQSAVLIWKTTGTVAAPAASVGASIRAGETLAEIEPVSLPPELILAQVQQIEAQRALDQLLHSNARQSQALKAVEEAEQQLENARHPEALQASAAQALAEAQSAWEAASRQVAILEKPASQAAIDQANSNLQISENRLNQLKEQVAKIQRQLNKPKSSLEFWESQGDYRKMLKGLEAQLSRQQLAYDQKLANYNRLLAPPDPLELAAAQAAEALASAELEQAQREVDRVIDGVSAGEIALLEAKLGDARREYDRVKDGPAPEDIQSAQARLTAAQATLEMARITAPFDGVITQVFSQPGDQAAPGRQAFRLDDLASLRVEVFVSEVDILKVKLGQRVELTFDGVSPETVQSISSQAQASFQGRVIEVLDVGTNRAGMTTYPVTIEVETGSEWIYPGMTATAIFTTQEIEDVILVPNAALHYENGSRAVYVLRGGSPILVPVELGATNGIYSQLLAGDLEAGDLVVTRFSTN
jgi:HlyD family secretion protein